MKIIYLTWGETPKNNGIFGSQVIQQIKSIKETNPELKISLISGVPILNSGLVKEKNNYKKKLFEIENSLLPIKFHTINIYAPQNFFYSRKCEFKLFSLFSINNLKNKIFDLSPDVIHCRSYHAAWVAIKVKEKYNINYKVIFDARGLWPEEAVIKGRVRENSSSYKFMKSIETELLAKADTTIAVSRTMATHYKKIGARNLETIFLSALANASDQHESDYFYPSIDTWFCYIGSLSKSSWHTPLELAKLYRVLRKKVEYPRLLVVSQSDPHQIKSAFSDIPEEEIKITSTNNSCDLMKTIKFASFGLLPFMEPRSKSERLIAETMLATKTVEYLAAGLPVIVNKYCGGAADLIEKHKVGISYDPSNIDKTISCEVLNSLKSNKTRQAAKELASENFDFSANAKAYNSIYQHLLKNP